MLFRFVFAHRNRTVSFGPYETLKEAKEAFQRRYGYWPDMPVETISYYVNGLNNDEA